MPAPKPEHTGLRRILNSYRWRRRFVIMGVLLAVGVPGIWASIHYSNVPNSAATGGKATIIPQPKSVPFTRSEKRQVHKVLATFLSTAVARRHLAAGWAVTGPGVREGLTKKQWESGAIPVQPFPISKHGLGQWDSIQYSYPHHVGLEVMLFPKRGSGEAPATADVDVVQTHRGRWVVNYFMPNKFHGNPVVETHHRAKPHHRAVHHQSRLSVRQRRHRAAAHAPRAAIPGNPDQTKPGGAWWALPLSILALIFVIPLGFGLYRLLRNRRAYNEYLRSRSP